MNKVPQIAIIIPLYNEEDVFPTLTSRINSLINSSDLTFEVLLIDDGSRDNTPKLMEEQAFKDDRYKCIFLSRNYGHQLALSAGLENVTADEAVFIIDADLQDPPELLDDFYKKFQEGYEVVYSIRKKRKEGLFKRIGYFTFYRIMKLISYYEIPLDSGDFSLISRRVVDIINSMPEQDRFIRGIRSWIGFKQIGVEYERQVRAAGEPKYKFKQLSKLALTGIFNFSYIPIRLVTFLGIISFLIALFFLIYNLILKIFFHNVPQGYTSIYMAIVLFSGVQLISLGILGEYIIRIFYQVKKRPLFIVKSRIENKKYTNK
ncbi:MAG: glycosyltransferase family 2 protein [Thermodesulfobacteriota bacterium]